MSLKLKVGQTILYILVLWSICDPKQCVSTAVVVSNTNSVPCKNQHNQTEYCDSTCAKCVVGVGCMPSSKNYCYIRSRCIEKNHLFTRHGSGIKVCQMACQPDIDQYSWTPAKTGLKCNDGIYCNGADFCEYDQNAKISKCSRHLGDPCKHNAFCNNTGNEKAKNCFREKQACDSEIQTEPRKCTEENKCSHGKCTKQPIFPRPSCTVCECENQLACNVTNGMCYKEPTKHDSVDGNGKNNEFYNNSSDLLFFLLLSSFVSALCMTGVIFLVMQCRKMKIERDEKFRTMYHRVNDTIGEDDDPEIVRVINKGL